MTVRRAATLGVIPRWWAEATCMVLRWSKKYGNPDCHPSLSHVLEICSFVELKIYHMRSLYRCFCLKDSTDCDLAHYQEQGSTDKLCSQMSCVVCLVSYFAAGMKIVAGGWHATCSASASSAANAGRFIYPPPPRLYSLSLTSAEVSAAGLQLSRSVESRRGMCRVCLLQVCSTLSWR